MSQKLALELAQGKSQGVAVHRGVLTHLLRYTEKHQRVRNLCTGAGSRSGD